MSLPRMVERICRLCGVALVCGSLSGCGDSGDGYQAVSGVVTFKSELVPDGSIQFFSDDAQAVVRGGAMIREGNYQLPREHGLVPGNYLVRISSTEKIELPEKGRDEMNSFLTRERIPAKFNSESELKIEVQADKPAEFNFDLQ